MKSIDELAAAGIARAEARARAQRVGEPTYWVKPPAGMFAEQVDVFLSDAEETVVCCGAQSGKTFGNPWWILRQLQDSRDVIRQIGKGIALYCGPTLPLLNAQAIPDLARAYEGMGKMVTRLNRPTFVFDQAFVRRLLGFETVLEVRFAYLSDPDSLEAISAICALNDEAGQKECKKESREALRRRLSVARSLGSGRMLDTTTPYVYNWWQRDVYSAAKRGDKGYAFFNWPTWSNPLQDRELIEAERARMPDWRWRMMYLGEFTRPAGAVYDCFDSALHVVQPFEIPGDWPIFVGVDFGTANTASVVLAKDPKAGTYYVIATYHGSSPDAAVHVERIFARCPRKPRRIVGGSLSEDRIRREFRSAGLDIDRPAVLGADSVAAGILSVYRLIKQGGVRVFSTCERFIDDLLAYSYEIDADGKTSDRIQDKDTFHRLDAFRYIGSSLALGEIKFHPRDYSPDLESMLTTGARPGTGFGRPTIS